MGYEKKAIGQVLSRVGHVLQSALLEHFAPARREFVQSTDEFKEDLPFPEYADLIRARFTHWPKNTKLLDFVRDLDRIVRICQERQMLDTARQGATRKSGQTFQFSYQHIEGSMFQPIRLRYRRIAESESPSQILFDNCSPDYYAYANDKLTYMRQLLGQRVITLSKNGFVHHSLTAGLLFQMANEVESIVLKRALHQDSMALGAVEDGIYTKRGASISPKENKDFWKLKVFLVKLCETAVPLNLSRSGMPAEGLYRADEDHPTTADMEKLYSILMEALRHVGRFMTQMGLSEVALTQMHLQHEFMMEFAEVVRRSQELDLALDFSAYQVTSASPNKEYWTNVCTIGRRTYGKLLMEAVIQVRDAHATQSLVNSQRFSALAREMLQQRLLLNQTKNN